MILLVERIYYWINYQYPKWYFSYSHHLSAWYCIDIVRGNSVTRFKWLDGLEGLWIGHVNYFSWHVIFLFHFWRHEFPDTIFPKSINVSSPHIIYRSNLWRLTKNMKLWKSWLSYKLSLSYGIYLQTLVVRLGWMLPVKQFPLPSGSACKNYF